MKSDSDTGVSVYTPPVPSVAHPLRLYKKEKLCSATAIDRLFVPSAVRPESVLAYPLRAVWMSDSLRRSDTPLQFLISVPKRRLHHAVDRVTMRRRVREAYRLHRHVLEIPAGMRYNLAFVYVADRCVPYARVERAVCRILAEVGKSISAGKQ